MNYDEYLMRKADEYYEPCKPKVVEVHSDPQDDGYDTDLYYNCQFCDSSECEYWANYNEEIAEAQAQNDESVLWG